jgi:hypothetical protein
MKKHLLSTTAAAVAVAGVLGAGAGWVLGSSDGSGAGAASVQVDPATAARTSFPGLASATGEPVLPGLRTSAPAPGSVEPLAGPFDDRFTWKRLALSGVTVRGSLLVTSDVSTLLELQVLVGFYDRAGDYLGPGRFTYHLDESEHGGEEHAGPPSELAEVEVAAPARFRDRVASAVVGVPVLVNE